MKIVSIAIQKGGAGKTTTALNLAAALRERGKRCLLIDLDPQASLSRSVGIFEERDKPEETKELQMDIYQLLKQEACGKPEAPEKGILERSGLKIIPASLELASAELELVSVYGREHLLSQLIQRLPSSAYDYVLLDCPPSIGMLTVNALVASDYLLMPLVAEFLFLKGAESFLTHLKLVGRLNSKLRMLGFVLTKYDGRRTMTTEVEQQLQSEHGPNAVFRTHIRNCIALAKAQQKGEDIFTFERGSHGAEDYANLADEFLAKGS